jgi:hypothetical protein
LLHLESKLPNFSTIVLAKILKVITPTPGLGNLFSVEADLSGIAGRKDLFVDQVVRHCTTYVVIRELVNRLNCPQFFAKLLNFT